ncbi:green-sensitive opsin-3-like [Physella acuta]|uniref:green-sensitive opsin-3-like n=1 Tax=Physella acuta TaxID=109671 RepID=UPI0027DB54A2|nr:green-sensitive opsin-3-like [Physella acuta]
MDQPHNHHMDQPHNHHVVPFINVTTHPYIINTTLPTNQTTLNNSLSEEFKTLPLYIAARYINLYYLWVIFAFGFPGNIFSFITILRMKPLTSPTGYVAAVAFVDNACLLFKVLFHSVTKFDVPVGDAGCGIITFLGSFSSHFANWLLVAMTVERCLAICMPLRVGSICTK